MKSFKELAEKYKKTQSQRIKFFKKEDSVEEQIIKFFNLRGKQCRQAYVATAIGEQVAYNTLKEFKKKNKRDMRAFMGAMFFERKRLHKKFKSEG